MKKIVLLGIVLALFSVGLNGQTGGILSVEVTTATVSTTATDATQTRVDPRGGRHGSGRSYAPQNIIAIWVEDNNGKFVKTLLINARRYTDYLTAWVNATSSAGSTYNSVDAVTGATNMTHGVRVCTWDGTDFNGNLVADGSYVVKMELTEANSTGNSAAFPIIKGESTFSSNPDPNTNFSDITLKWEPNISTISK
jgi:hypothetical protein